MAQRNIFIDPQGFVRISVKIIDVREAFFRVATDVDLARSVTGRGGGGDFADWRTCLPAKSFKHDQLLYVIQKVSELTGVPLVSCRPWLCMPRDNGNGPVGPVRPVAALLPQHLQMTISEIILAHTAPQDPLALSAVPAPAGPENQPEFVFVGKAMAHMTDRGCELAPIAKNLAHLPQSLNLEVFEQIAPEEVRRFSGDKTVAEAGLSHGSVLLFRSALQEPVTCPPHGAKQAQIAQQQHAVAAPAVGVSSCVPSGGDAAGAAGTASAPAAASATEHVAASATAAGASAEATDAPAPAPVTAAVPGSGGDASLSQESPPALIPAAAVAGNGLTANGTAEKNAPGWDGGHIAAAAGPAVGVAGAKGTSGGEKAVVMDAEAQQRATYLALFQVQENARQHQVKEAARAVAKKLAAEAALAAAKEKFKKDEVVAAAAKMAAHAAAMEHAQSRAANTYRTISITEALREGAPPTPSVPAPPATAVSDGPAVAGTVSGQAAAQAATALKSINVAAPVSTASSVSSPSIAADAGAAAKVGDIDAGGETESGAEVQVDVDGGADALPNTAVVTDTPTDTLIGGTDPSEKNTGAAPSSSSIGADEKEGGDSDELAEIAAAEVAVTVPAARATPTPVAVPRATRAGGQKRKAEEGEVRGTAAGQRGVREGKWPVEMWIQEGARRKYFVRFDVCEKWPLSEKSIASRLVHGEASATDSFAANATSSAYILDESGSDLFARGLDFF
ncbi:unnamed protein product [Scytosiphon promiscuus]